MENRDMLINYLDQLIQYLSSQTGIVMFMLDRRGNVIWSNAAFRDMIGRQQQVDGLNIRELLAPESRGLFAEPDAVITDNMHLLFSQDKYSSHMLTCRVLLSGDTVFIVSEQVMATETAVMRQMTVINNELSNMSRELHRKNIALEQAMAEIKVLKELLPICMHCKKIRDEKGYWSQLEAYISKHTNTQFSHGICEDCLKKFYPVQVKRMQEEKQEKG